MFTNRLECTGCGVTYALTEKPLVCTKCGKVLEVEYNLEEIQQKLTRKSFRGRVHSLWRYHELLPIAREERIVSIGEGLTATKKVARYGSLIGIPNLALKLDYLNPTGSFKDRGTTVNVSKLK